LTTTRADWSAAQIIAAYRGQARAERTFRDLKDPWVCAFRPQYHWTDQKLIVHAFMALPSLLLVRVLLQRAAGGLRRHPAHPASAARLRAHRHASAPTRGTGTAAGGPGPGAVRSGTPRLGQRPRRGIQRGLPESSVSLDHPLDAEASLVALPGGGTKARA